MREREREREGEREKERERNLHTQSLRKGHAKEDSEKATISKPGRKLLLEHEHAGALISNFQPPEL